MTAKAIIRSRPKQERAQATYEHLLDVAGELLAEVGIDRISTNLICARAGLTPPALYRYFEDKYAVLEALGRRLMERQNIALERWVERHADGGIPALRGGIRELLLETAMATRSVPGAVWILRALHATPRLIHVRLESHRYVTDILVDACIRHLPTANRDELWQRLRLSVELGFAADEMLQEETRVAADTVIDHVAQLLMNDLPVIG
jgi:AcrR family transcriptional regulator